MNRLVICILSFILFVSSVLMIGVSSRGVEETAHAIINELAQTPYIDWSPTFLAINNVLMGSVFPCTLLIPNSTLYVADPKKSAAYHIVPEKLDSTDLAKRIGSRLPTLLAGHFIEVSISNSSIGYFLDGVQMVESDVYVDNTVAIHRIAYPLDFSHGGTNSHGTNSHGDLKDWAIILTSLSILAAAVAYLVNGRNITLHRS